MKHRALVIYQVALLAFATAIDNASGADGNSGLSIKKSGYDLRIEATASQIEMLWPNDIKGYSLGLFALIKEMPVNTKERLALLEGIVCSVLEKDSNVAENQSGEVYEYLLGTQSLSALLLLSSASALNVPGSDRLRYCEMSIMFTNDLRGKIIPNYKWKKVYANVSPPISSGPMASGMNPAAIQDPVAREAYLKRIRKNERNSELNSIQSALNRITLELSSQQKSFLNETAEKHPELKDQVERLRAKIHDRIVK